MFFSPAIAILQNEGHDILGTSRDYREANELSRLKGLNLLKVGRHGGSNLYEKLFQSSKRVVELTKIVSKFSPDLVWISTKNNNIIFCTESINHMINK